MKLSAIFASREKWSKVTALSIKPSDAYKILKYIKLVNCELELIESQRVALLHRITDTEEGVDVTIENGTPEFDEYVKEFTEVLDVESDLEQVDMEMQEFLDSITSPDEILSVGDLLVLEPFFRLQ